MATTFWKNDQELNSEAAVSRCKGYLKKRWTVWF
jgi:hypothetical protein